MFGSLKAAMGAAGLPYPPHPYPWDERTIVAELRRMHAAGQDLSLAAAKGPQPRQPARPGAAPVRLLAQGAIGAAGIDYATVERVREWSRASVVRELRARWSAGRELGGGAIQKEDVRLWAAAKRHFGSYQAALDAAGIAVPKPADE